MTAKFNDNDLAQMASLGLSQDNVQHQMDNFRRGFPKTVLIDAATVDNGGILRLEDADINKYADFYKKNLKDKKILKFLYLSVFQNQMFSPSIHDIL